MSRFATLVLALLIGGAVLAPTAEAIPSCMGAGDVTLLGPDGCVQGGMNFFGFNVSPVGVAAKIFLGTFSTVIGQDVNLTFQVSHDPSPSGLADILFYYTVKPTEPGTGINGIDLFNPGHNVTIRENACATDFLNGVCPGGLLADLVVPSNSFAEASFLPQSTVFLRKDIQLLQDSFISEFTNSHDLAPVPEPATLLLLGSSLTALGVAVRRRMRREALPGVAETSQ
jgi:hypothetical protein